MLLTVGDLDATFGSGGKVTTDFGGSVKGNDLAIQSDGKIVVVGDGGNDFVMARYNVEGSLDPTFNNGNTDFGQNNEDAAAVAIQNDGKIVVVGSSEMNGIGPSKTFAMARYRSNGSLDFTFSTDGKVTDASFMIRALAVAIQGDGKIVVAGQSIYGNDGSGFAVVRYNSDGTVDTTFGNVNGRGVQTHFQSGDEYASHIVIDDSGRIVVIGHSGSAGRGAIARYNGDGSLDTTFGNGGKVLTTFADHAAAIQSDGKILVAGSMKNGSDVDFAVARYDSDGTLDTSFGIGGTQITNFGPSGEFANSVAIQGDGKIVVTGTVIDTWGKFAVARYNHDGSIDTTFASGGKKIADLGPNGAGSSSMAVQKDGNIVMAGSSNGDFLVARLVGVTPPKFSIAAVAATKPEGSSGNTVFTFLVSRDGGPSSSASVDYAVTGSGSQVADAADFGGILPSGTLNFANGESSKTITINVSGDSNVESNEGFTVTLSNPSDGFTLTTPSATGTILADDFAGLSYTATGDTVLSAIVLANGHLQVMLDSVVQDDVDPVIIQSLIIVGGDADDIIDLSRLSSSMYSHLMNVTLIAGAGDDTVRGTFLSETISGGAGNDSLRGGDGNDLLIGDEGSDTLDGEDGNDDLRGGIGNDSLLGGFGIDSLIGDNGNDTLAGEKGNDFLSGGLGDDSLSGGDGTDRLIEEMSPTSDPAAVSMVKLAATTIKTKYTMTGLGSDTIADIEELSLAGSAGQDKIDVKKFRGSVTLSGNGGNDTLIGGAGNDSLDGGEGNDKLTGNGGTNQLDGGSGTDWVIEAGATNFVLTPATLTGLGNETLNSIERASLTTANTSSRIDASAFLGNTILTGGSGNDTLLGGAGKDSISGGDGNDTLIGGNANDTLDGGAGDDALVGQNGHDLLIGGDGQDTLIGSAGNDTLKGGLGDDLLIGGLGKDSLDGEAGNDTGLGGQGGAARGGNGQKNSGDSLTGIEQIDETLATLFAWE